jgi:hypothetical protein
VVEDLARLKCLHGTTIGGGLFLSVCEILKELDLPWTKLKGLTTDGAPSLTGRKTGLVSKTGREMNKQNPEFYMELHCIIHQRLLFGITFKFEHEHESCGVGCELHSISWT